ncbi:hypothetical protein RIF29_08186 [Crotalaria pallida]|uniref:Uncharacterized protein n=1 Tax=Crotalaria pallida TaxID=3830 RepID=A0AAN9J526_CROPI
MEWGGEDWDFMKSEDNTIRRNTSSNKVFDEGQGLSLGNIKKENLLEVLRASSDAANGTVKLKISKKELKELLGVMENQNKMTKKQVGQSTCSSAEQVLFRLMKAREHVNQHQDSHHRPWSPVLQTISEVNGSMRSINGAEA